MREPVQEEWLQRLAAATKTDAAVTAAEVGFGVQVGECVHEIEGHSVYNKSYEDIEGMINSGMALGVLSLFVV